MDNPIIDVQSIRNTAKTRWLKEQRNQGGLFDQIGQSVPWWVIIIGTGLAALSAGHTAGVFNQLSPIGYAGPFVVEFALLWAAFSRVISKQENTRLSSALRILEILAFIMALIANGVGALERVTAVSGIKTGELFGSLPIQTQAVILVIPLFALFIPIGTWVAGEGIASLLNRGKQTSIRLELAWNEVERDVLYRALFNAYLRTGMKPGLAKRQASLTANGFVERGVMAMTDSDRPVTANDGTVTEGVSKRDQARALLADHPDWHDLSLRQLEAKTGIDRNSWAIVKSQNGIGKNHTGKEN